jgi:hypothetical protein
MGPVSQHGFKITVVKSGAHPFEGEFISSLDVDGLRHASVVSVTCHGA